MRQKRRQASESATSAQSVSKPSRYLKRKNHHAQVGLDRDGRPADQRVEERDKGLEEDRVVEQAIYLFESWWKGQELGRQDCLPQGRLGVYLGAQHDGSVHSGKRDGAIVVSFGPEREHPANTNTLVASVFHIDFFRSK